MKRLQVECTNRIPGILRHKIHLDKLQQSIKSKGSNETNSTNSNQRIKFNAIIKNTATGGYMILLSTTLPLVSLYETSPLPLPPAKLETPESTVTLPHILGQNVLT